MDIGNKYLRSWLRFDESATKDFIAGNHWTVSGNPTISTTNAINGKALQLDGSSYLKLSGVELAGRAFTLDCVAYVDASSPNNARLFSITNPATGYFLATVRKSATQSNYIDAWANSHDDCSQNYGYTVTVTAATGVENRVHVALIYNPSDSGGHSAIYVAVNGYVVSIITVYRPTYKRSTFDVVIGALPNGNQGLIGSIDEFRIYDGAYLFTDQQGHNFTPPDASFYNTHEFWTDTIRKVLPASAWWYSNEGVIDTLVNTTTAVQLTDLPTTQSRTGKAFYQTTRTKIFDVPSSKEVWVKFDVYFNGSKRWRAYDNSTGSESITGVTAQTDGRISFFNRNTNVYEQPNWAKINELQTIILHMIADSTNGLIEVYTDDSDLLYAYTGEVNNGTNFANLYLQSDGSGTFFSNVIISNSPLWFDDNVGVNIDVDYLVDVEREIENSVVLANDTSRRIYKAPSTLLFDTERVLLTATINVNTLLDTERQVAVSVSLVDDTERLIVPSVTYNADIERIIGNNVTLNFDTERVLVIVFDTIRMTYVPASKWRYENIGKTNDLLDTSHAVQLSNLPATQSKTGYAFYQTDEQAGQILPAQSAGEVWIKFDIYRTPDGFFMFAARIPPNTMDYGVSSGNWYIEDEASDSEKRLLEAWGLFYEPETYYKWTEVKTLRENSAKVNEIQTVIVHMKASSKPRNVNDGFYEIFTEDGGLLLAKDDYHTDESAFTAYHMCGGSNGEAYVSNIIISNQPLWFDDNALVSEPVSIVLDVNRQVGISVSLTNDVERELLTDSHSEYLSFDTAREIVLMPTLSIDTLRDLSATLSIDIDLERMLIGSSVSIEFDAVRQVGTAYLLTNDAERLLVIGAEVLFDVEKSIYRTEEFLVDLKRQIPYQLVVDAVDPTEEPITIPIAQNDAGLQSINIQIAEQQVTDRVTFVHAGYCEIMDKIQGRYRDYDFDLRIEETTQQGVLQECSCCSDIDEILYSQIAYTIPENKFEWADDFLEWIHQKREENPNDNIIPEPSTTIEEHLRAIAQKLGKGFVYRGTTFYSTNSVKEQEGRTYASVLSDLIGWTSRLPQMMVNAYFRAGTMYVIQRGYEANTVILDNAKVANVRINKKLVRTTWGSDVVSNTKVKTYTKHWDELDKEPYNPMPEGGGTMSEDGLVETKTTISGTEKNETTYYYATDEDGSRYLEREVTVKYENTNGAWEYVDTITTTHEKVSTTQSHISATNADGEIVGETLSPNRFDDRATPYDMSHGGNSYRGYVVISDGAGNKYKLYRVSHYSEEIDESYYTTYGLSLIDTSFPVYGDDCLSYLTQQLIWLNRKVEETVTMDVYDINHIIGFDDKISLNGVIYYLSSNTVLQDAVTVNKQSLTLVRWY